MSNKFNGEQYIGRKFGRLEVISVDKNKRWNVICKCKCGNIKSIKIYSLLNGATASCGCLHKESVYNKLIPLKEKYSPEAIRKQNITRIKNNKIVSRNKTGVIGVCYLDNLCIYRAYININGKRIYLGDFDTLDEATVVRKNAEKKALQILENERLYYQSKNSTKKRITKHKGVCLNKNTNKYFAYITRNGKRIHLGVFINEIDAINARKEAEQEIIQDIKQEKLNK